MSKEKYYIHREVSWLGFNYRVLQEAKDINVPLLERVKFLAIYSSNLDEYFRVRVANLRNLVRVGKKTKSKLDYDPEQVLKLVLREVSHQQKEFSKIFKSVLHQLEKYHIYIKGSTNLDLIQQEFVNDFFYNNLLPYVQPVLLIKNKIRPFLNNATLYLVVHLKVKGKSKNNQYAIVQIPSDHISRFIELPSSAINSHNIIYLDDIVRYNIPYIFPGYDVVGSYSIKLTRDAELYIDDEFSGDLLAKIKSSLSKRNVGPASRMVYDRDMPNILLKYVIKVLELDKNDIVPEGRYHNNFDLMTLPSYNLDNLKNTSWPNLPVTELEDSTLIFDKIREKDHLIHVPYQSYESAIRFFEDAAFDPTVTHIKIVQYRVAKKSRIMNALMEAVRSGKSVSAFVEVKARFDEEANLKWGESLTKAGVKVHYSFPGLKVHAKIALIRRMEGNEPALYTYLSTGNFHEGTAKVYSDFGLFTAREEIVSEVSRVFAFLETVQIPDLNFDNLLVGQFNLRTGLENLLEREIKNAENGEEARIFLKINSLQDRSMIDILYKASNAGVKIKLIIRGICCLVPGVKGQSENIEAISIVDRYLEHARIFLFYNGGDQKIFLSSADWMERNLSHRIEVVFPILDEEIKNTLVELMEIQWSDNVKARSLHHDTYNTYMPMNNDMLVRSQQETYYYLKRKSEVNKEKELKQISQNNSL